MILRKTILSTASMALVLTLGSCNQSGEDKSKDKSANTQKKEETASSKDEKKQETRKHNATSNHTALNDETTTSSSNNAANDEDRAEMIKISEAFGNFIGRNLNTPGIKFDLDSIIKGMREGVAGKPSTMTDQEYEEAMTRLQLRAFKELADDNLKTANDFLSKNSKEDGVVEIVPEKLQYVVIQEGNGATVEEHSSPSIQYVGKFADGTTFGSSVEAGGPITVPLDQTIPGFSKGLLGMKEGEKRRLYVHPDLGYGTSGQLPPNSLLIFEVEVIKANDDSKTVAELDETDSAEELDIMDLVE